MAFPTIVYNASTGSDTAASGAGPATALTGAAGASTGAHTGGIASTTITLLGTPDLSGVAADGSAAIWINTTAGTRHLSKITAVNDGADTVTVQDSFTIASGASALAWAIGGKRQTLENDTTNKDWEDMYSGWTFEFNDGTYTISEGINPQAGDATDGPVTFTATNHLGAVFDQSGSNFKYFDLLTSSSRIVIEHLDFLKTNSSWQGSKVVYTNTGNIDLTFRNCRVNHQNMGGALDFNGFTNAVIHDNEFYGTGDGTFLAAIRPGSRSHTEIFNNTFHDMNGPAISDTASTSFPSLIIRDNTIYDCTEGIIISGVNSDGGNRSIINNTVDGCTNEGILLNDTSVGVASSVCIKGNNVTNNGTYGISVTTQALQTIRYCDYNNVWNNTTANYLNLTAGANSISLDPQYVSTTDGAENFTVLSTSAIIVPSGPTA